MVFVISENQIDTEQITRDLQDDSCGAVVTFEGRVRIHNNNKTVRALEYETYRSLAVKEAEKILEDLKKTFRIQHVRSYHRVGRLEVGELSFWLGVSAPHREHAFEACKKGVDRIKKRAPIWKKEMYEDGSSQWINLPEKKEEP